MRVLIESNDPQKMDVCIITMPLQTRSGSYYTIINNFIRILSPLVNKIFLITSNFSEDIDSSGKINIIDLNLPPLERENILSKTVYLIDAQIRASLCLIRNYKHFTGPVFILSGALILPVITGRALRKTSLLTAVASGSTNACMIYESAPFYKKYYYYLTNRLLEMLTFNAAQYIGVESPHVALFMGLPLKKVIGNGHLFVLNNNFKKTCNFADRPYYIGYIGRLSREKGIQQFVRALPTILGDRQGLRALIGGGGELKEMVEVSLQEEALTDRVDFLGWIPHDDLPKYINRLRLLVLPSYTEGLPNIVLEAMACGTPVLATPVGAIPDIIIDGRTGFIMENSSPDCIVANVHRALNSPELELIAENGKRFVEENFTYERTVENWRSILQKIE